MTTLAAIYIEEIDSLKAELARVKQECAELEWYKAAFWLVAEDYCFLMFKGESPFLSHPNELRRDPEFAIGANMNDTFYFACADCEDLEHDEVIPMAKELQRREPRSDDAFYFLVDWASKKRGHDPNIPKIKKELDEWRKREQLQQVDERCKVRCEELKPALDYLKDK